MAVLSAVSIRAKVVAAFAVLICCLGGLGVIAYARLQAVNASIADVRTNQLPSVLALGEMNSATRELRSLEATFAWSGDAVQKARDQAAMARARTAAEHAFSSYYPLAGPGEERQLADDTIQRWQDYLALHDRFMALAQTGDAVALAALYRGDMRATFDRFQDALLPLVHFNIHEVNDAAATAAELARSALIWILGLISLKAALSVGIGCAVSCGVAAPVTRMTEAMRRLARRDLTVEIPDVTRRDEIGAMAGAVQVFKDGLIEAHRLNAERETGRAHELQRLRQLADGTFEGIVIHRDGVILTVNVALCDMLGEPDEARVVGQSVLDFMLPVSEEISRERMQRQSLEPGELELRHRDGSTIPVAILLRRIEYDGAAATLVAVRDLSERRQAEARIRQLAFHDALTGLPNRALLQDRLTQALELSARTGSRLAVLYLDLDRFKFINDLLGHEAGDQLLIMVAARLSHEVRATDTVARMGGDEFVVVQTLADHPQVSASLAQRIIKALSAPYTIQDQDLEIGVSIGIATYPDDGDSTAALLKNGDIAMYRAKAGGRGQYQFFAAEMDVQLRARRDLERELRGAFNRRELVPYFQPLYDCADRTLKGFEALLRWPHPVRGAVSPTEFIPIAEECGLILPLGRWVLEAACTEAASWPGPWSVAVNLSPIQFQDPGLVEVIAETLERTGLAPERLELEVTESVLISDPNLALETLTRVRSLGIRISLDDFGTGYSSLSYLRRFPFDKLKIDRSFIQDCDTDADASGIVAAIVTLANCLHIGVVAEGVEKEAQLQVLAAHRCHQAQGFLLGRPHPAGELRQFMVPVTRGETAWSPIPAEPVDVAAE